MDRNQTKPIGKKKLTGLLAAAGLSLAGIFSGVFLIGPHEHKVNTTYLDPVGIVTSCYGHTGPDVKVGKTYTNAECIAQFTGDIKQANDEVNSVIHVTLTMYQRAALISFTYNVGVGNLRSSTLARLFNQKKYEAGCKQLLRWVYAGGKKLKGLVKRRQAEYMVCMGNIKGWKLNVQSINWNLHSPFDWLRYIPIFP